MEQIDAKIIVCKCGKSQSFGIRVQKMKGDWLRTWAFKVSDGVAKNEGYSGEVNIKGSLFGTDGYPGCPYCGTNGFFICGSCGKMNCYHGESKVTCAWCDRESGVEAADSFDVKGGGNY